jgi:hypothetical protein
MFSAPRVYSPTALPTLALALSAALLAPLQLATDVIAEEVSTGVDWWANQALFCRDHNPLASSGHKTGWCL